MNGAIGLAAVLIGASRVTDLSSAMHPRTAVLWIPLVLAYWIVIGLRASFFVPSELPAAWSFHANAPMSSRAYWSAVRASMMAFVVPKALLVTVMLTVLLEWQLVAWHALWVLALVVLLIEVVALTVDFVPFTRSYRPGHAKLRTRWPLYYAGFYVFGYWSCQLELRLLNDVPALLRLVAIVAGAVIVLELIGRRRAAAWSVTPDDESDDLSTVTTLDLGLVRRLPGGLS